MYIYTYIRTQVQIVYQDRVVEKIVEVPIEKIVYIDKIKEVPFEKIVYRDRDVAVEVQKFVERVVDR
jgi:hypothetical protein